ncbi:progesterone-induced-blocking factor 1-like [Ruditapes philippinarum]|uniref:progesterone-induced-blocking factor 1-like n=1 Tax=Ruditapes philippinarum TaxID=129788 RepID=UPI00295BE17C|nr:progesterone-induced-blocking factor 1-like [Ruditapes philippinarum]
MAARDLSKTFDEFESEDLSGFETSVPTDLTLSPDRTEHYEERRDKKSKITKQLIERKQLSHDLQLVRIELSQKNLQLENMKAESLQRVDDLEEKLNDERHQKQILQARLESQLTIQQEESRRRQELIKAELDEVREKQRYLEATNERLQERAGNVRRSLRDLDLTEEKFYELRSTSDEDLSLRDYVAVRLFERTKPLETEIEQLRLKVKTLEDTDRSQGKEVLDLQEKLEEERQAHGELRVKFQKLTLSYADTKNQVKVDDYKVENYDRVKGERDNFERDGLDVHRQLSTLEATHQNVVRERDELSRELSAARQSLSLLKQDKEYLTRQCADIANRNQFAEEKMQHINMQLDDAKRSREDMYEKYVSSREQYKSEYENKLREELEQIRVRTNGEIDRLRTSSKEMYERENRNLREARDMAISEKERAQAAERETSTKYEQILQELRQLQLSGDSRVSDTANELKLKTFELERTQLLQEETVKNFKETQLEVEKLTKKAEVLTKEYYSQQTGLEKRIAELESALQEKDGRLKTYEKLEQELDDVVMQAAEVDNEEEAEKVLFSYGYGANVPSTAKRRLQQSVHLARRVLQLEKINTLCKQDIEREKKKVLQLAEEVKSANNLLDQAQQPYNYLIESMRTRDSQISKQREYIASLEEETQRLEKEKAEISKTKNQMALDLERLLNQREEMSVMKQVVLNLSTRRHGEKKTSMRDHAKPKSASIHIPHGSFETYDEPNVSKPGSISLTRSSPPKWSKKLKNKNESQSTNYSRVYATATS